MTGLPDYGSDINVDKKIIPYLKYMPSKESFVGNDQENNKVNLKIDLNNKVAFDMNNIKSGWQWFKGDKTAPEKKMDAWVDGKCTPAPQPSAMTDANGEVKEIFCSYDEKKKYLKDNPDWVSELSAPKIGEAGILSGTNSRKHATGFRDVLERVRTKNAGSKINTEVF